MKVFGMNDTETVVAKDLKEAHDVLKSTFGVSLNNNYTFDDYIQEYEINPQEITDLENNYCYFGSEDENDLYDAEKLAKFRMSFKELIEKHSDECPIHFTTEI